MMVGEALLVSLRDDTAVQSIFGHPARIYDDETEVPAYPFVRLEAHETLDAGAAGAPGTEHRLLLGFESRDGGILEARAGLRAIRAAIERAELSVPGLYVVLVRVLFADVMRRADRRAFRGALRVQIITEEAE